MSVNILTNGSRLPNEYQEVEYIGVESNNPYIDTGITGDQKTKAEVTFSSSGDTQVCLFGYQANAVGITFNLSVSTNNTRFGAWAKVGWGSDMFDGQKHTVEISQQGLYQDGVLVDTPTAQTFTTGNLTLFKADGAVTYGNKTIYGCKIWNDGVLQRNLVPCYRKSDGVIGFYDLVSNTFFTNAGTGDFTKGSDIQAISVQKVKTNLITITSSANNLPSEYQEVEWIKSKDNAYINPNANITADIGFEVTANIPSGTNGTIIGNYLPGNYFFFVYSYTNNTTTFFPSKNASTVSMTVARDTQVTFSFKNGVLDDGTTQTTISTYATAETGQPIYLFSGRPNNWFTSYTLYRCKIYNGSTVVKDLIPCYRKADGEIGLYDLITENFYSNANSVGSFEKGNDVNSYTIQKMKLNLLSDGVRLPTEYEEVEYLQSSGTQYIDTGIKLSSYDTVKCKFEILSNTVTLGDAIYGAYDGVSNFFVLLMRSPSQARVGTSSNQASSTNLVLNKIYDTSLTSGTYIENGTTYNFTKNGGFTINAYSCYLFSRNQAGATNIIPVSARVYSFEIVDKLKGVPCYRKSDNVAGFYDMVSKTFFTNAGTGSFIAGPRVNLPDEYQEVEYVEGTGTQYIDTGINPTDSYGLKVVISNLYEEGTDFNYLGARTTTSRFAINYYYGKHGCGWGAFYTTNEPYDVSKKITVELNYNNSGKFAVDGNNIATLPNTTISGLPTILIFAQNTVKGAQIHKYRIHQVLISNGVNLVRKFIPCYRKSDNVAGLYDMQDNQFYTNAGTGTFSVGNDIPKYKIKPVKMNILKQTNNLLKLKRTEWNSTSYQPTSNVTFDYNKLYYMAGSGYIRPYPTGLNETITNQSVTYTQTNSSWWGIGFPFEVKPNTKYTIGAKRLDGNKTKIIYTLYNADGSFGSYAQLTTNTSILDISLKITTGANTKTMIIVVAGITQNDTVYAYDLQVEEGQTRTSFKPYGYEIIKI